MTSNGPDCPPNNANSKQPRHCHKFENLSSNERLDVLESCKYRNATKKLKIHYFENVLRII